MLLGAHLEGAELGDADLTGTDLRGAHLEEADLRGARLQEAKANTATAWPMDFDPEVAGVVYVEKADNKQP